MEKDINISILFAFYGRALTEKQYNVMESYYLYDNSLGEIAESLGITRQSVRGMLLAAAKTLSELDEKLHFKDTTYRVIAKLKDTKEHAEDAAAVRAGLNEAIRMLEE